MILSFIMFPYTGFFIIFDIILLIFVCFIQRENDEEPQQQQQIIIKGNNNVVNQIIQSHPQPQPQIHEQITRFYPQQPSAPPIEDIEQPGLVYPDPSAPIEVIIEHQGEPSIEDIEGIDL